MATLIIGIIFFLVGIFYCFQFKWRKINAYIPLIIGVFLVILCTIGPLSKSKTEIAKVMNIKSTEVVSIEIHLTAINGMASIARQNKRVVDEATIKQICAALNKARLEDEGFIKSADSACSMKFNLRDNAGFSIGIWKDGLATRVNVNSNGESGWHHAVLEANELGKIIDRLAY